MSLNLITTGNSQKAKTKVRMLLYFPLLPQWLEKTPASLLRNVVVEDPWLNKREKSCLRFFFFSFLLLIKGNADDHLSSEICMDVINSQQHFWDSLL